MTVRTICRSFAAPLQLARATGFGPGGWFHIGRYRPSALLGNADHVAIVNGHIARSAHTNAGSLMEIEVRIVWHGAGPDIAPWKTHRIVLGNNQWTPGDMAGFPFFMVQRMGDGNIEPLDIFFRVIHHQNGSQPPAGLADAFLETLTVTFFDLQSMDDESIPWTYVEGQSVTQFGSSDPGAVLTGSGLPLTSPDNDGSDYWPLFWDVGLVPRRPGEKWEFDGATYRYPVVTPNQWRCVPTVTQSGGTVRSQWIGHGFASRHTASINEQFRVGGHYLHHFPAGQTTDYFEVRGVEDTSYGDAISTPLQTIPATTSPTASFDYALFTFAAHKLNLKSTTRTSSYAHYGPPKENDLEFLLVQTDPIRTEWDGDQFRSRVGFFGGVGRHQYAQQGRGLRLKTDIEYSFAQSVSLGANGNPNPIYVYQTDETEHTPDIEIAEFNEIRGVNSIQARGEWSPSMAELFRADAGEDYAIARKAQLWTIEQKTGIDPYVEPNPQPGADVYVDPIHEALDASQLPDLPTDPVRTLRYRLEHETAKHRPDDGELISWPMLTRAAATTEFHFMFDLGAADDAARWAEMTALLGDGDAPAFRFTPHGEVSAKPYVVQLSSVNHQPGDKKVVRLSFSAFELEFTAP